MLTFLLFYRVRIEINLDCLFRRADLLYSLEDGFFDARRQLCECLERQALVCQLLPLYGTESAFLTIARFLLLLILSQKLILLSYVHRE